MTPVNLMHALQHRVQAIVGGYQMRESDSGTIRAPKVWAQHLPEKLWDETPDPADYPFVQIIMDGGTLPQNDTNTVDIVLLVGGYDDGQPVEAGNPESVKDRQGWMIPAEIIWRIVSDIKKDPTIGKMYRLQYPIEWDLPAEQPAPIWYGSVSMSFSIPLPEQDFGMEHWKMNEKVPYPGAMTEQVQV